MTETLISLLSILAGIIGANLLGFVYKKYTFGIIGNTISGVFGSIFFIKSLGRLGFDPLSIMQSGTVNWTLFTVNILVSLLGGIIGIIAFKTIKTKMNK
ncbi:hypothetical protein SCB49_02719 [unidentified eubacterium SCB49]|nr:hypothetical protein SCB49_02719 [unidentified eubacterium SCB49]